MGVRLGASVGPISASTRLDSDGALSRLFWGFAALLLALALLVSVSPVVLFAAAIWLLLRRPWIAKITGLVLAVASVMFAIWLWPREYVILFRSGEVPDVGSSTVAAARESLAAEGFGRVEVLSGDPAVAPVGADRMPVSSPTCVVTTQSPKAGKSSDQHETVHLTVRCPLRLHTGYTLVPNLIGNHLSDARRLLNDAHLPRNRYRIIGPEKDPFCPIAVTTPPGGAVVRTTSRVTIVIRCIPDPVGRQP